MTKINKDRKGCIDVFNSFLVVLASYAGVFEFPVICPCYETPNKLILFSMQFAAPGGRRCVGERPFCIESGRHR